MTSAATNNPSRRSRRLGQTTADPHQAAIRLLSGSPTVATAYILPSALIYGLFIFLPILASLGLSLTSWDGLSWPQFIGLGNYLRLSTDPQFWTSLKNNGVFVLFYAVLPLGFGLLLTAAIGAVTPRERTGFRFLLFLPYVLPMALVGIVWQWLYNPAFGPIAQSLRQFGLGSWAIPFLGSFDAALPAVGFVATWSLCGFCMVLLLSGVQRLDPHLFEAAELDGATRMEVLRHITIPGLVPEIRIALLLTVIASIKAFDLIFVMTRGGPGTSTLVTSIYMYENGFRLGAFGYSAAVAVIGAVLVLIVNQAILVLLRDR